MSALTNEAREGLMALCGDRSPQPDDLCITLRVSDLRALLADSDALAAAEAQVAKLREALEPLIGTAESYAMQTYDRSGCTRRQIEAGQEALAPTAPEREGADEHAR